jgi:uncharacterized protein (UPF0332 family)
MELGELYLLKADESLAGAESEFANGRYDNCANRCYYACFQAAVAALQKAGITPDGHNWGHAFVQSRFSGQLVNRRKVYPAQHRDVLMRTLTLRQTADYAPDLVSQVEAARAVRRTRDFVNAIRDEVSES